jgi:hypothetical protein
LKIYTVKFTVIFYDWKLFYELNVRSLQRQETFGLIFRRLFFHLLDLSDSFVDALSKVVDIFRIQTSHLKKKSIPKNHKNQSLIAVTYTYTSITHEITRSFILQEVALVGVESSERKHADLFGDVIPLAGSSKLFQTTSQLVSHKIDSVRHFFDVLSPLCSQFWCVQYSRHNSGAVCRRIRVVRPEKQ